MISGSSPIATPVLTVALQDVSWAELFPYVLLSAWAIAILFALLHPVTKARLHCMYVALSNPAKLYRVYTETAKERGKFFSRTTCIALINKEDKLEKVFYGKPELFHLLEEKQNGK